MKQLKQTFPLLFEIYDHFRRVNKIKAIEKTKKMTDQQQLELLGAEYERLVGHKLDWKNLRTYTEKMQYEKFYHVTNEKADLSDKYKVRAWVADRIGEKYLIPLYGVWDKFSDINFDNLPDSFVLKTNHGSGSVIVVKDKKKLNKFVAKLKFTDWLHTDYGYKNGFEKHYSLIKPNIIAEAFIDSGKTDLQDYKFLCFGGKPYYCWVDTGRFTDHKRDVFDLNWELQSWNQASYGHSDEPITKPDNFDEMVDIATKLCKGFEHVRVDLYNVNGRIYFGEMTFTNGGGLDRIIPEEYDLMLGNMWNLDTNKYNEDC